MTNSTERRGFVLAGRVQGVGFRWWTRQTALKLGLTGTVRNLADGRVEVHAGGHASDLSVFRELLQSGPAGADVREILETPAPDELPADFVITH